MIPPGSMTSLSTRVPACVLALLLAASIATNARAQDARPGPTLGARTRVIATRDEVRVIFPADDTGPWSWPAEAAGSYQGPFVWGTWVHGTQGGRTILLGVNRPDSAAGPFPTLEALVSAGRTSVCPMGEFISCSEAGAAASVDRGRVTLHLRGRPAIETLFALRPAFVRVYRQGPNETYDLRPDSARVEYRDPQIPTPTRSAFAAAERARRREEADATGITRYISSGARDWGPLWMVVGDSATLRLVESACHYDSCIDEFAALADSGWSVGDSSVVRLRAAPPDSGRAPRYPWRPNVYAVARATGRTTIHVRGVHGPSDTLAARTPVAHQLHREVVVTRPITRVEIWPRVDTMRVGETKELRMRVVDDEGHELPQVPVEVLVSGGAHGSITQGTARTIRFDEPGAWVVMASFAGKEDTLTITVVANVPAPP